jgi:hypothetical protein
MSTDILLSQSQDLVITNGDLALVTEGLEVTQSAKIRILHILGEWVFDYTLGVDWFGVMFSTSTSTIEKKGEIQKALTGTTGLRRLLSLDFSVDSINRAAQVDFTADTDFGALSTELTI